LVVDLTHGTGRRADDQRVVGKLLALGYDRAGADQAVAADLHAVEHDRAHADEAVIGDRTAVQDHRVADGAAGPDRERKADVGVQDAVLLNVRAFADLDPFVVAAQARAVPTAGVALEPYGADADGALGDQIPLIGG